ncbi:uncharacterized protein VTP21DRAFT_10782 [Calcarisporiella thermophila]|uniref:uncharacterized protein n=1 Tax=Calcarisporiella thermophila TaxID=911321 RepID=UPI003742CDC5
MLGTLIQSAGYPSEIAALIQYKLSPRRPLPNFSGNKKRCYEFLNQTSRSFAAVIQELDEDLRDPVCLFYLVLRGLDTIEDDMTLPLSRKTEILQEFHKLISREGWNFTESGPNEKDRQLLVEFQVVVSEFLALRPPLQDVIARITKEMGEGMAKYANGEHRIETSVATVKDFDLYCYYVAGLVGLGLNELFVKSGLEDERLLEESQLAITMGYFLQKTNIIRDYLEDLIDKRQFWPKDIWSQYADDFAAFKDPKNTDAALACLSHMCANALAHVPDCLTYLSMLKNQSVFNFCAIPQVMAIATLALLLRNPEVFKRNVKIRKGEAVQLIYECTDIVSVANVFRRYARMIAKKNDTRDPNFLKISIACGQIEKWCDVNLPKYQPAPEKQGYPSLVAITIVVSAVAVWVACWMNGMV